MSKQDKNSSSVKVGQKKRQDVSRLAEFYRQKMIHPDGSSAFSETRLTRFDFDLDIVLLPNPTPGMLYIRSNNLKSLDHVRLINPLGKVLYDRKKQNPGPDFDIVNLSDLSSGVYFVIITSDTGAISNHKVIRE